MKKILFLILFCLLIKNPVYAQEAATVQENSTARNDNIRKDYQYLKRRIILLTDRFTKIGERLSSRLEKTEQKDKKEELKNRLDIVRIRIIEVNSKTDILDAEVDNLMLDKDTPASLARFKTAFAEIKDNLFFIHQEFQSIINQLKNG